MPAGASFSLYPILSTILVIGGERPNNCTMTMPGGISVRALVVTHLGEEPAMNPGVEPSLEDNCGSSGLRLDSWK